MKHDKESDTIELKRYEYLAEDQKYLNNGGYAGQI